MAHLATTAMPNSFAPPFEKPGARLAVSSDLSSALSSGATGIRLLSLGGSVTLMAGRWYSIELLIGSQGGTTLQLARAANITGPANGGLVNAQLRFAVDGTGASVIPSTVTLSSGTASGATTFWVVAAP